MNKVNFPVWPVHTLDEIEAVSSILASGKTNYWKGGAGREFEMKFSDYVGCEALTLSNGTVALEACLRALEIGETDEVIVTPRSFVASASVVCWVGAKPIFCDIDLETFCLSEKFLNDCLSERTRAVIAVHFGGCPANVSALRAFCDRHGLALIEDCAQAHGAKWLNRSVGSFGDISAWSFCVDKIMSTGGEGGMVTSPRGDLLEKVRALRDHGKNFSKRLNPDDEFHYMHDSLGSNWRLTEMQSAIGSRMLSRLDDMVERRRENAEYIENALRDHPAVTLWQIPDQGYGSYYRGYLKLDDRHLKATASLTKMVNFLNSAGIPVSQGGCGEVYREGCFSNFVQADFTLPNAKRLSRQLLMYPTFPTLSKPMLKTMADSIRVGIEKFYLTEMRQ